MTQATQTSYLQPYLEAAREHGAGFGALLWASVRSQRARFAAICRAQDLTDKSVLDAGCGRADLMAYLSERGRTPADYIGLEAVPALADAADARKLPRTRILRGDFVRDPRRLFVGADVIIFSGSLNTIDDDAFYTVLRRAWDAAGETVVFNFLSSNLLAGKDYLVWRPIEEVNQFVGRLSSDITVLADYMDGDCTIAIRKPPD